MALHRQCAAERRAAEKCSGVINTHRHQAAELRCRRPVLAGSETWPGTPTCSSPARRSTPAASTSRRVAARLHQPGPQHHRRRRIRRRRLTGGTIDGAPLRHARRPQRRDRAPGACSRPTRWRSSRAAHLTLSGRYNRTTVENRDAIIPGGGPGSLDGDHAFGRFNPAIGITFAPSPALTSTPATTRAAARRRAIELGCADPANPASCRIRSPATRRCDRS